VLGDPIPYCNYTLPNGQQMVSTSGVELLVNKTSASDTTYFGKPKRVHIGRFTVMRGTIGSDSDEVGERFRSWQTLENVNATECGLEVCVQKYTSSMNKTIFTEKLLGTFTNTTDNGEFDGSSGLIIAPPAYITPPSSFTEHSDDKGANIFKVETEAMMALESLWSGTLQGALSSDFWEGYFQGGLNTGSSDVMTWMRFLGNDGVERMVSR
jgi:hypothetical protein